MELTINRQKQPYTVKDFLKLLKINYCRIIKLFHYNCRAFSSSATSKKAYQCKCIHTTKAKPAGGQISCHNMVIFFWIETLNIQECCESCWSIFCHLYLPKNSVCLNYKKNKTTHPKTTKLQINLHFTSKSAALLVVRKFSTGECQHTLFIVRK